MANGEAEGLLHLLAPLRHDAGRAGDDDPAHLLAEQQLAEDQPCLDGLSHANVVSNEETDAGHEERLAERLELVGLHLDASAVRQHPGARWRGRWGRRRPSVQWQA